MALIGFIVDEIFTLGNFLEDQNLASKSIAANVLNQKSKSTRTLSCMFGLFNVITVQETNSPAILLLLISSSRAILQYNCKPLKALMQQAKQAQQSPSPLGPAYRELDLVFHRSLVTVLQFERLLSLFDGNVQSEYQLSKTSEADRKTIEKDLLINCQIPEVLLEPVRELLGNTAESLRQEVNVAELYFTNVGWLGLTNDQNSKKWRKQHPLDAMRKVELRKDARARRCTRCCALMDDALPQRPSLMMNLQRTCFCGGSWAVLGEDEALNGGF